MGDTLTILVVEDDRVFREALVEILRLKMKNRTLTILEAGDVLSAHILLQKEAVDVITVDFHLPHLVNGEELVRDLRNQPKYNSVLIVGLSNINKGSAFRNAGANAFVNKENAFHLPAVIEYLLSPSRHNVPCPPELE